MPRPRKGPRLYLRKRKGAEPVYVIRDGQKEISTGCAANDIERATSALRYYLAEHFRHNTGERELSKIYIPEVLMLYLTDLPTDSPSRQTIRYHVKALSGFWGEKSLADVKGSTCREYVKIRTEPFHSTGHPSSGHSSERRAVTVSTARQELKTLQTAVNHWVEVTGMRNKSEVWKFSCSVPILDNATNECLS